MISCFLQDKSLHNRVTGSYADADVDSGNGYLTDQMKSYFDSPKTITDNRTDRLTVESVKSTYTLQLHFDATKDDSGIDYSNIPSGDYDKLFNIIEALAYNVVADDPAYETLLTTGSTFDIYSAGSLERSITTSTRTFYIDGVAAGVSVDVQNWFSFDCTLDGVEETIKVWTSRTEFIADYPHVLFTHITYPDDPTRLLSGSYTGAKAMADSATYASTGLNDVVSTTDNTGVKLFTSTYNPGGIDDVLNPSVVFVVYYKGKEPSTTEVRDHIRTDLLGKSLTTEAEWKTILPDLFTSGRFFLVPLWDNIETIAGPIEINQGIVNHKSILDLMDTIFTSYDNNFVIDNLEIIVSSASEMYIAVLPSNENELGDLSLQDQYPTYQPIDGTNSFFNNQTLETQNFNIALAGAIATLIGASNTLTFSEDTFVGRQWITFSVNFKEYHVLKSDQFPESY